MVPEAELRQSLYLDDRHLRVYRTVEVFSCRIIEAFRNEDTAVDVWFVIIPDDVYRYGRPLSQMGADVQVVAQDRLSPSYARELHTQPSLFPEDNILAQPYQYDVHFHNQLKARLLEHNIPTQIIRESTIAHHEFLDRFGNPTRKLDDSQSEIAWNLSTATFYKSGGKPWKLGAIRRGEYPVLRGLADVRDERTAYLWTKGFVPRLQTYPGREVPWPLLVGVCRGKADIRSSHSSTTFRQAGGPSG